MGQVEFGLAISRTKRNFLQQLHLFSFSSPTSSLSREIALNNGRHDLLIFPRERGAGAPASRRPRSSFMLLHRRRGSGDPEISPCSNELACLFPAMAGFGSASPPMHPLDRLQTTPRGRPPSPWTWTWTYPSSSKQQASQQTKPACQPDQQPARDSASPHNTMNTTVRLWRPALAVSRRAFSSSSRRLDKYAFIGLGQMVCLGPATASSWRASC